MVTLPRVGRATKMKRFLVLFSAVTILVLVSHLVQAPSHSGWHELEVYSGPLGWLRRAFLESSQGVSVDAKALVAGLSIGDKTMLSSETADAMKVVSLTHLTAVSGANCAIVIGAIFLLLGRFAIGRWVRFGISFAGLCGYVLLVGPQASVLRASVMAAVVLLARTLGRNTSGLAALSIAIILLLIWNPWLAIDYGFALSALATVGILVLAPAISQRLESRLPKWLAISLSVSLSAQLLCMPVLLQLQPGISTYSIPANLIAEPLVAPVTILGMFACLVSPLFPVLAGWATWLASLATYLIIAIADFLSSAPSATISWPTGAFGVVSMVFIALAVLVRLRANQKTLKVMTSAVIGLATALTLGSCTGDVISSGAWPPKEWEVVSCDVGQGDATVIRSNGAVALIDVGRKPRPVESCLRRLGIRYINLLVLTHFDLDHVGGLSGALEVAKIDTAMITSYQDERPAAAITYRELRRSSRTLIQAGLGLTGDLGDFKWKVLSPHQGAPEAEDSNDGSVTMLFQSPRLNILTLADLGEKGQMRLASESAGWLGNGFGGVPLIVKVSHHGSADQYPELYEALGPNVALVSVGAHNDYGHPTRRTLDLLQRSGSKIYRTDLMGGIAVGISPEGLQVSTARRG